MSKVDMGAWRRGRVDAAEGPLALRWHQVIQPISDSAPAGTVVLNGFACDAGVARNQGRVGAADGPGAIRHALRNMPVHECERLADAGDVVCTFDALETAQSALAQRITSQLERAWFPLTLGGGHEVAFASFMALAMRLSSEAQPRIGIVNLDAHFDLRRADRANSGTAFLQMADVCEARGWPFRYACLGVSRYANTRTLFERARTLDVLWFEDDDMKPDRANAALAEFIAGADHVYLTVCLDVLPATVAPGVSAPAPRGVGLEIVEPVIEAIVASGKLRLADIAEMNPRHDVDGRTAAVAARIAARIANGVARGGLR